MKNKHKKTQMPDLSYIGKSRYICDVLEEMRVSIKTLNFSNMLSLIEEVQVLANRMESALDMKKSIKKIHTDLSKLKDARKALVAECELLIRKRDKHVK